MQLLGTFVESFVLPLTGVTQVKDKKKQMKKKNNNNFYYTQVTESTPGKREATVFVLTGSSRSQISLSLSLSLSLCWCLLSLSFSLLSSCLFFLPSLCGVSGGGSVYAMSRQEATYS